jgi:hypothetical protein
VIRVPYAGAHRIGNVLEPVTFDDVRDADVAIITAAAGPARSIRLRSALIAGWRREVR